jgi:2-keto-4-pentenoate hydratase/2-oxohepta-3-ene-1,7-dioic acid hydratase in catechol pathway
MRFGRLVVDGKAQWARLDEGEALLWSDVPWAGVATSTTKPFRESDLLSAATPSKIIGIGRNYTAHAKELGNEVPVEPLLFLKPPSALLAHGGVVELPSESARVEYEAELGVIIGRRAKDVPRSQALAHVFGYTCVCDITARDLQKKDGQWTRAKGFDGFCPCGPWIETGADPRALRVRCILNGATKQDASTSQMVFDVAALVAYASNVMTLEPGDLIATGTPDGTAPLASGDAVTVDIEHVGALSFTVR